MTTFIDFRYSRALAAALFTGQEKEEVDVMFAPDGDTCVALHVGQSDEPRHIATLEHGTGFAALIELCADGTVALCDREGRAVVAGLRRPADGIVCLRVSPLRCGLKAGGTVVEEAAHLFAAPLGTAGLSALRLDCGTGTTVMGRGSGRAARWASLFYYRTPPTGLCVELTMDWHHLRAGIPLFGTMTAEELVAGGVFRLRFRSYAFEAEDAETADFVRLFGCDDSPDIAVHLTPALYDRRRPDLPNLGFAVAESEEIHRHLVDRCNAMDRVCVPTTFVRDAFLRAGVTRPIDVVSHGVDTDHFRPVVRKASLPGGRAFNFLAVSTHVERKNVKQVVRAFLEEFRADEDVALFLLLRPEYHTTQNNVALEFTDWEREWATPGSAPIFLWTGYVTRDHLRDFYANADAYVMPSNEGFGLTLLEAMASGTPVIGLRHGGVVDFVNDENGLLVPPGRSYVASDVDTLPYVGDIFYEPNLKGLRDAMRRLFEDPALGRRLAARGRTDAERLNWTSVTADFARVIEHAHASFEPRAAAVLPTLTFVLCTLDDEDATRSLDCLRDIGGDRIRTLCLFTRYARVPDILRARRHGFACYRWDGSRANCRLIARSIVAAHWALVLHSGERLSADPSVLTAFLNSQPPGVTEVMVPGPTGALEERVFRLRDLGSHPTQVSCDGIAIQRRAR